MYGSVRSRRRTRVRLTRRGRIVVVAGALLLAGVLVLITAPVVTAAAATGPGGSPPGEAESGEADSGVADSGAVAVVRPGDTLWSVAARHLPSHDAPGVVGEIRHLNDLSGTTIHPGQRLRVPAR